MLSIEEFLFTLIINLRISNGENVDQLFINFQKSITIKEIGFRYLINDFI